MIYFSEEWLKQEYGPIFDKVIMVEPVMQKVRFGSGSKFPSGRMSVLRKYKGPEQKRRNPWFPNTWMGRGWEESDEDFP